MRWLDEWERLVCESRNDVDEEMRAEVLDAIIRLVRRKLIVISGCPNCGSLDCAILTRVTPLYVQISRALKEVKL